MLKILLVGSGAREHAIAKALKNSKKEIKLFCFGATFNPGIKALVSGYEKGDLKNNQAIINFAKNNQINWAIIGPEDQLANGIVDALADINISAVGPTKNLAQIESSKSFTRDLLVEYQIDVSPKFQSFESLAGVEEWLNLVEEFVIKEDGLAGGKGVQVQGDHFKTKAEGFRIIEELVSQNKKFVLEEKLIGQEFSLISFCDGENLIHTPAIQDHKRVGEGDVGSNTGGMGTYSDKNFSLPFLDEQDIKIAQEINLKTANALKNKFNQGYIGFLYGGFIKTKKGIKVIEYNSRLGDPEAMNILALLTPAKKNGADFLEICEAMLAGNLAKINPGFQKLATVCKYVVPQGYPDNPVKNEKVDASQVDQEKVNIYYAAVDEREDGLYLTGSRAIALIGLHENIYEAEKLVETEIQKIKGPVIHRKDIGTKELIEKRVEMMKNIVGNGLKPFLT